MSNPYTPPSAPPDAPALPASSNRHIILRSIGAISLVFHLARMLWERYPDFHGPMGGIVFQALFIYGFIRGGKKFLFVIALLLVTAICLSTSHTFYQTGRQASASFRPWIDHAVWVSPLVIACACAITLWIRARRAAASSH